jgi:hypothetical protein
MEGDHGGMPLQVKVPIRTAVIEANTDCRMTSG